MKIPAVATRHAFISTALAVVALFVGAGGRAAAAPIDGFLGGTTPPQLIGPGVAIVSTAVHDAEHHPVTSVTVGSTVHPSFVVSGVSGTPSGGIGVYRWNNATCSGFHSQVYGGVLTTGALDAWYLPFTSTDTRTISYRGHYDGNGVYAPVIGPCKSVTFTRADPSVVLKLHDADHKAVTSARVGDGIHVYVEVSGQVDEPTGSVKVGGWNGSSCGGLYGASNALSGGKVDTAFVWPMDKAGTFAFRVQYQGDSTYKTQDSPCLVITVNKHTPMLTAELHDANHEAVDSALVGESIHAGFHLSGTQGTPTGSVTINRFPAPGCEGSSFSQVVPAAADVDPAGTSESMSAPGSQWWQVHYPGSATYAAATSPCIKMTWRAVPSVAVTIHDAGHDAVTTVSPGTPVHLRVKVGGDFATPTGQVKVRVHANGTCSDANPFGTLTLASGVAHDGGVTYEPESAGTYSFSAAYKGDGSYAPTTSSCVVLQVAQPSAGPTAPTASTAPSTPTSKPSTIPTETPTPTPTADAAGPTPVPVATDEPTSSTEPSPSSGATIGSEPGATDPAGAAGGAGVDPGSTSGDGGGAWILPIVGAIILVALFLIWASRRTARQGRRAAVGARQQV